MKTKDIVLICVAVACALGAVLGIVIALVHFTRQLTADKMETVEVLVAKGKLAQWTTLQDPVSMFERKTVLRSEARAGYWPPEKISEVKGRTLRKPLDAGEMLAEEDLVPNGALLQDLPPGKRCVGIPIYYPGTDHIVPGCRVNVIHTRKKGPSELILKNILVRAIDMGGDNYSTAILEVDDEQASKLARLMNTGTIILVLWSSKDDPEIKRSEDHIPPPPPIPPPEKKPEPKKEATAGKWF